MKRITLTILSLLLTHIVFCQTIINGNFETNTAGSDDQINLSNSASNAMLPYVNSFGSYGDVDIIKSLTYGGSGAQDKTWYLGITGGGTDIIAMSLTQPLVAGKTYSFSFYDRKHNGYTANPIQIGISESNSSFGTAVYTAPNAPVENSWTQRTFTFTALQNEKYITVQMPIGDINQWANIDNFVLTPLKNSEIVSTPTIEIILPKKDSVLVKTIKKVETVIAKKVPVKFNRHKLNGRKCIIQETLHVPDAAVKLQVWDKNTVDGDMVSIYLNGQLLEDSVMVTSTKKELVLYLQAGSNLIVMQAINLGSIPPNTATIGINNRNKNITLVSDLKESGAIELIFNPSELVIK